MAQILRFFAWIAWGVVTTIIFVGLITTIIFEGASSLSGAFAEPATILILLGAYLPGGALYLLGHLVEWMKARENAGIEAKNALNQATTTPEEETAE